MQFQLKKASEKRIFYPNQHREILLGTEPLACLENGIKYQ